MPRACKNCGLQPQIGAEVDSYRCTCARCEECDLLAQEVFRDRGRLVCVDCLTPQTVGERGAW